jgi:hypothetical protein
MYFYIVEENYAKDGMRLDVGIASGVVSACLDRWPKMESAFVF